MILDVLKKKYLEDLPAIPAPPVRIQPDALPPTIAVRPDAELPDIPSGEQAALPIVRGDVAEAPPVLPAVPVVEEQPPAIRRLSPSEKIAGQLNAINAKDYSIVKDAEGRVTHRGKDRDKKWSTLEKIGNALTGFFYGGIPGAVQGATDRNYNEYLDDAYQRTQLAQAYNLASGMEKDALEKRLREEQIKTIPTDDANKKMQIQAQVDANNARVKNAALGKVFSTRHFDPNNPVHRRQAEIAGLNPDELKGWDDRNPIEKQVAGVTYRLNRDSGMYEPTNLPADESKALTDYRVEMPNGEMRTFKVAHKDAANFATQWKMLGARIEATAVENQKGRDHQIKMKEYATKMQIQLEAFKTANDMAKSAQNAQQRKEYQDRAIEAQKEYIRLRAEAQALKDQK